MLLHLVQAWTSNGFFAMEGVIERLPSINPNLLLAPKALYIDLAQLA